MIKYWLAATASCLLLATGTLALAGDNNRGRGADDPPGLDDNPGRGNGGMPQLTQTVLEFQTMVGVDGPFLGGVNPIRRINGGGLPWVLDAAKGELRDDGKLEVEVLGLIIPVLPDGRFGFNPAPFFRAAVSCLTLDQAGMVAVENVFTDNGDEVMIGDPREGDAKIEAWLDLPQPCLAPIVFVTNPAGAWFAVTGVGSLQ